MGENICPLQCPLQCSHTVSARGNAREVVHQGLGANARARHGPAQPGSALVKRASSWAFWHATGHLRWRLWRRFFAVFGCGLGGLGSNRVATRVPVGLKYRATRVAGPEHSQPLEALSPRLHDRGHTPSPQSHRHRRVARHGATDGHVLTGSMPHVQMLLEPLGSMPCHRFEGAWLIEQMRSPGHDAQVHLWQRF